MNSFRSTAQMAWLADDLESLAPGTPVVTFSHIPLISSGENIYGYQEDGPAPTLLTVDGETSFQHTVRNTADILTELRQHDYTLALSGHFHMRDKLFYENHGVQTRFYMSSAVRNDTLDRAGMDLISGLFSTRSRTARSTKEPSFRWTLKTSW